MAGHNAGNGKSTVCAPPSQAKQAFVIVFDSKRDEKLKKQASKKRREASQLEFINATTSQPVPGAREIIRTHVMSDYWRKKTTKKNQKKGPAAVEKELSHTSMVVAQVTSTPLLLSQPLGGPDPFSRLPIDMKPFMYDIIDYCKLNIAS